MYERWLKGSFTVEASLILGLIIACVMVCVYSCLYLHDKVILEGAAHLAAQRGRLLVTENQDMETGESDWTLFSEKGLLWRITGADRKDEVCAYAASLVEGRLIVCETPEFSADTHADFVEVSYQAATTLKGVYPLGDLFVIPQINGKVKDQGFEQEEFLRLVKGLLAR